MSTDLVTRLRAANPVDRRDAVQPPVQLLSEITAAPREDRRRRRRWRAGLLVPAVALLIVAGALAGDFSARYFDEDAAVPADVLDALDQASARWAPIKPLDLDRAALAYVVATPRGAVSGYYAPYGKPPGFCLASVHPGEPIEVRCNNVGLGTGHPISSLTGADTMTVPIGGRPLDGVHALVGQLDRTGYGVSIAFEDGSSDDAALHGTWFAYVVAGAHTEPGARPVRLEVHDADGRVVQTVALHPLLYNSRAQTLAAVPASDGSPAQDAIRRVLVHNALTVDGGELASRTKLAQTRSVRVPLAGHELDVYLAPIDSKVDGDIRVGMLDGKQIWWAMGIRSDDVLVSPLFTMAGEAGLLELSGPLPPGATRVALELADGGEHAADVIMDGTWYAWLAPIDFSETGDIPKAFKAYGADGQLISHVRLDPATCATNGCLARTP